MQGGEVTDMFSSIHGASEYCAFHNVHPIVIRGKYVG